VSIPYATERHVEEFKEYSHRFDFVQFGVRVCPLLPSLVCPFCAFRFRTDRRACLPNSQKLPKLRLLRTANNIGLLRALACELQVPPCRLRLWPIINRENSTMRIDVPPEHEAYTEYVLVGDVFCS
jgi:hypothetical protein